MSSLKELHIMTLKILAAAKCGAFSEKDLVERIDFVVTDSTAHNLGVMEEVCDQLGSENTPEAIVCHVHHMMMFHPSVKYVFQEIHDALGNDMIKDCFVTVCIFYLCCIPSPIT